MPQMITFKLVNIDGVEVWIPVNEHLAYDKGAIRIIDDLGWPPDTNSWIDQPETRGFFFHETLAGVIFALVKTGYEVRFLKPAK